jgi:putative MATE family efflux protein
MRDLTQGPVTKTLVALAVPTAFGMLFQTLYLLVDLYFIAGLGDAAVAGVGSAGTLMFAIMSFTQVLAVSSVALISQAVGRKQRDEANHYFNQGMLIAVCMCLLTLVLGYTFADSFMSGIAADDATLQAGMTFLYAFLPGMSLQFVFMTMASALRATGIVKPGMVVQVATVLLNTILAPVLIAGWGPGPALGVLGAGLATTISVIVGVSLLVFYFIRLEKYVAFSLPQWKPDLNIWKRMLVIGLPAGGEMLLMFVYFSLVYVLIQDFGAEAQAGFSIGGRIMQSIFMPTMSIAFAIGPMTGQNYGAGMADRVREISRKGIMLSAVVMGLVMLVLQINPYFAVAFFTPETAVIEIGGEFLRFISLNFIAQGIVFSCSGMFQGLGNTRPSLMSSIMRLAIFIPLAFLVSVREGFVIHDIWYVSILAVWFQAGVSLWLVQRELKLKLGAPAAA